MAKRRTSLAGAIERVERASRLDETGRLHPFYSYSVPTTEQAILALAESVDGTKAEKAANVEFFKSPTSLVHVVERDRWMFGGREQVPAMEAALVGMAALESFLISECVTQSTPGPNRGGKTKARIQKVTSIQIGEDPRRPGYEFPFDASKGPIIGWSCVPAKNTRTELMDLQRLIPPHIKYKMFTAKGDERIEFDPTDKRPFGAITRIKSYSMPVDQFQREAVHWISMDERSPQYIWDECRMRLLSTNGWMILAMALYDLELWLYEKNRKFDAKYRNLKTGSFGWYSWYQTNCPWVNQARAAEEAAHLSDDARSARVFGDPKLLSGTSYFKPAEIVSTLWQRDSKTPRYAIKFDSDGVPAFLPWVDRAGWRVWQKPERGCTYALGADVALGGGGDADYSTIHIIRIDTSEVVAVYQNNEIESDDFGLEIYLVAKTYNQAVVAVEVNVERAATHHWLKQHGYPRVYQRMTFGGSNDAMQDKSGWYTDSRSKNFALEELRVALKKSFQQEAGGIILYDSKTYEELSDFGYLRERRHRSHGLGGLSGHDDLVMSLAIALQASHQAQKPKRRTRMALERNEIEKWDQDDIREAKERRREEAEAAAE